uniref:Stonin-2 n=1 Tax=Eptatretus burgeri TaxID=7764 RepID=A0A8C4QVS5_EPTBU
MATSPIFPHWVTFEDEPNRWAGEKADASWLRCKRSHENCFAPPLMSCNSFGQNSRKPIFVYDSTQEKQESVPCSPANHVYEEILDMPLHPTNPFFRNVMKQAPTSPPNPFVSVCERLEVPPSTASTEGGCLQELIGHLQYKDINGNDSQCMPTSPEKYCNTFVFSDSNLHMQPMKNLEQEILKEENASKNLQTPSAFQDNLPPYCPDVHNVKPRNGWPLLLRIPEKKNKMSSRQWGRIFVVLKAGVLHFFYKEGMSKPFKVFKLQPVHELSKLELASFNEQGKVHVVRIDQVQYKQKRKFQPKLETIYSKNRLELLKFGTTDYENFTNFVETLQDELMQLPICRSFGSTFVEDAVIIHTKDCFKGVLDKGGRKIMSHSVNTHVYAIAFISGMPTCEINFKNSANTNSEVITGPTINSTSELYDCQFHPCVHATGFNNSYVLHFCPVSGQKVELVRFGTALQESILPLSVKVTVIAHGAYVEVQAWLLFSKSLKKCSGHTLYCSDVTVCFPIPETWVPMLCTEATPTRSLLSRARHMSLCQFRPKSQLQASIGTANYEHSFRGVMWRIKQLPDKNMATDIPHCLYMRLELGSDAEVMKARSNHVCMEYDVPGAICSNMHVASVVVPGKPNVYTNITSLTHFHFQVEVEMQLGPFDSNHVDEPRECTQQ